MGADDEPAKSLPLAMQRLFYRLQTAASAVSTKELTRSFGWDAVDSFTQHDASELERVMFESLEESMKSSEVENEIDNLFRGELEQVVRCVNVPYESRRGETFYDMALTVTGMKSMDESLKDFFLEEALDGDNQYRAEGYEELQDAKKGYVVKKWPAVLHVSLKRFEMDYMHDVTVKVNDEFAFEDVMDLAPYVDAEAAAAPGAPTTRYRLHGVLVHWGDFHAGHYFSYIKAQARGGGTEWFKFNDEKVTVATEREAIAQNFGGDETYTLGMGKEFTQKNVSNAYFLVYYREDMVEQLLRPLAPEEAPPAMVARLEEERRTREEREKAASTAHLYATVKVVGDPQLRAWEGETELTNWEAPPQRRYKVLNATSLNDLKASVEVDFGVPAARQRFWSWTERQNKTFRPREQLTGAEEGGPISAMGSQYQTLRLLLADTADTETVALDAEGDESGGRKYRRLRSTVSSRHRRTDAFAPCVCGYVRVPRC